MKSPWLQIPLDYLTYSHMTLTHTESIFRIDSLVDDVSDFVRIKFCL